MLEFTVQGEPIPQGSMRSIGHGRMTSDNPRLKRWRRAVAMSAEIAARVAGLKTVAYDYETKRKGQKSQRLVRQVYYDEPVMVWVQFFFAPPQRPRWATLHGTKPDLDKLQRAIGDALELGNIISNDSRICAWPACPGKQYGEPRVEIRIASVAEVEVGKAEVPARTWPGFA